MSPTRFTIDDDSDDDTNGHSFHCPQCSSTVRSVPTLTDRDNFVCDHCTVLWARSQVVLIDDSDDS